MRQIREEKNSDHFIAINALLQLKTGKKAANCVENREATRKEKKKIETSIAEQY